MEREQNLKIFNFDIYMVQEFSFFFVSLTFFTSLYTNEKVICVMNALQKEEKKL